MLFLPANNCVYVPPHYTGSDHLFQSVAPHEISRRLRSFRDKTVDYLSNYVQFYNEPLVVEFGPFMTFFSFPVYKILEGVPKP